MIDHEHEHFFHLQCFFLQMLIDRCGFVGAVTISIY